MFVWQYRSFIGRWFLLIQGFQTKIRSDSCGQTMMCWSLKIGYPPESHGLLSLLLILSLSGFPSWTANPSRADLGESSLCSFGQVHHPGRGAELFTWSNPAQKSPAKLGWPPQDIHHWSPGPLVNRGCSRFHVFQHKIAASVFLFFSKVGKALVPNFHLGVSWNRGTQNHFSGIFPYKLYKPSI